MRNLTDPPSSILSVFQHPRVDWESLARVQTGGASFLHWALLMPDNQPLKQLLHVGAPLFQCDDRGRLPLHWAISFWLPFADNAIAIERLSLLSNLQTINHWPDNGLTPLACATALKRRAACIFLLQQRADPSLGHPSAFELAWGLHDAPLIREFLESGALLPKKPFGPAPSPSFREALRFASPNDLYAIESLCAQRLLARSLPATLHTITPARL